MLENISTDVYFKVIAFLVSIKLALIGSLAKVGLAKFKRLDEELANVKQKTHKLNENLHTINNNLIMHYSSKDEVKGYMDAINSRFDKVEGQIDTHYKELNNKLDDNFKLVIQKFDNNK